MLRHHVAEIAQLVEHNLAKVGVASSSLVCRSFCFLNGALVQLVRIHACHAWGHEFEPRTHRHIAKSVFHGIRFLRLRFKVSDDIESFFLFSDFYVVSG